MHHWATCLHEAWLFLFASSYYNSIPFHRRCMSSPISPSSLHPQCFISVPLTVPWHSKALLPSLTLFYGAADDNNWFENRRQWNTRIILHSHPAPPTNTHPAGTSPLHILPSTPVLVSPADSLSLSLSFLELICCLLRLLFQPHLSWTAVKLTPSPLCFVHISPERCDVTPCRVTSSVPAKTRSDITDTVARTRTHTGRKAALWNDNGIWLNTVTDVMSSFQRKHKTVTVCRGLGKTEESESKDGRGGVIRGQWVRREEVSGEEIRKMHRYPRSPNAEWKRNGALWYTVFSHVSNCWIFLSLLLFLIPLSISSI